MPEVGHCGCREKVSSGWGYETAARGPAGDGTPAASDSAPRRGQGWEGLETCLPCSSLLRSGHGASQPEFLSHNALPVAECRKQLSPLEGQEPWPLEAGQARGSPEMCGCEQLCGPGLWLASLEPGLSFPTFQIYHSGGQWLLVGLEPEGPPRQKGGRSPGKTQQLDLICLLIKATVRGMCRCTRAGGRGRWASHPHMRPTHAQPESQPRG